MKNKSTLFMALCIMSVCTVPKCSNASEGEFLGIALGYYNILEGDNGAVDFRIEYQPARSLVFKKLMPWIGLETTSNGSIWAGGGLSFEFKLADRFFLTPSLGAGLYRHGKGDINLNHPLEFRTQLELGYLLKNENRIGLAFSHLSNASLGRDNPGSESLSLYYRRGF